MSGVKRWEPENTFLGYNMKPTDDGSFVLYEHYQQDITRLQADVEQWKLAHRLAMQDNIKLQSDLTKARELLKDLVRHPSLSFHQTALVEVILSSIAEPESNHEQ